MRRKWYLGFGIILLSVFYVFVMLHDARWFLGLLIPIIGIGAYDFFSKKT